MASTVPEVFVLQDSSYVGDLDVFYDPASVAVVGASNNPSKWGYWLAAGALEGRSRRRVQLVNHTSRPVLDTPCHASLADLPEPPGLVAVCVPPSSVAEVIDQGCAIGVRGYLCITAGVPHEAELARRIRDSGARLIGANSLGIFNADTNLRLAWGPFVPGPLAIITQSGQLGSELAIQCAQRGIGISRLISVGNQTDVRARELLHDLCHDDSTKVVALYLEGFSDGTAVFDALRMLRAAGKPTLLLTVGNSSASAGLARSHTGSMTSPTNAIDAACRAAGVVRVYTPHELATVAGSFLTTSTPAGPRVGIVGDSGGQCGIAADVTAARGLAVPELEQRTMDALAPLLPSGAGLHNPVDLAGAGEADLANYAGIVDAIMTDPKIDTVLLTGYFGRYATETPQLAAAEQATAGRLAEVSRKHAKTLVVHSMDPDSAAATTLWQHGVPTVGRIEDAVGIVRGLARLAAPITTRGAESPTGSSYHAMGGYWAARAVLLDAGVPMPRGHVVRTTRDVRSAAASLSKPFVLKAGWLDHKSDVGGVALGLTGQHSALAAFRTMRTRLGQGDYVLEEQDTRPDCVEMMVSARRDASLGPLVAVGRGGTETEIWQDLAIECAPICFDDASGMLERLTSDRLLAGWRGHAAVDRAALARLVVSIGALVVSHPEVHEIELNPVRVGPDGVLAVDALVVGEFAPPDNAATPPEHARGPQ